MRVVFMGTPEFAVPSLRALMDSEHEVVAAITQPDRPAGRGHKLTACPVKALAEANGIPVYQFERIRREEGVKCLKELAPDLCVTAAFGQILSQEILDIPRYGTVNVHASLLPKHRGAAPINWCIVQGEKIAGVTTMLTDIGMDTGDMLLRRETEIGRLETAGELTERLSKIGAELLIETLKGYPFGDLKPVKQNEAESTYEPMLKKEMGAIDWTKSAEEIACLVRGFNPWPCAYTDGADGRLKIYLAEPIDTDSDALPGTVSQPIDADSEALPGTVSQPIDADSDALPGTVITSSAKEGLIVSCGKGALRILEMQAPNAKRMSAKDYLRGKRIEIGTRFNGWEK